MFGDVTVIVPTFGDQKWITIAQNAIISVNNQTVKPKECIHLHDVSLGEARNKGAIQASTKWLIFLDADDTLDPRYIEYMIEEVDDSTIRQPSTLGVYPNGAEDEFPVLIPRCSLKERNFLIIGSMCLREQFLDVGGFDVQLPILEDWDFFIRLVNNGAIIGSREKAIYRVGVNPGSRNVNARLHGNYYNKIRAKCRI